MWTSGDIEYVRCHASDGAKALAFHFGVSHGAVKRLAQRFGISLRQPGSNAGRRLGTPNRPPSCRAPSEGKATDRRPWTPSELTTLESMASLGAPAIAEALGRSERAVRCAARRRGVSLRTLGCRAGRVHGQLDSARTRSLGHQPMSAADRERALRDPQAFATLRALAASADLCPTCGRRGIQVESTGLCLKCHRAHLRALPREQRRDPAVARAAARELNELYGNLFDRRRMSDAVRQHRYRLEKKTGGRVERPGPNAKTAAGALIYELHKASRRSNKARRPAHQPG